MIVDADLDARMAAAADLLLELVDRHALTGSPSPQDLAAIGLRLLEGGALRVVCNADQSVDVDAAGLLGGAFAAVSLLVDAFAACAQVDRGRLIDQVRLSLRGGDRHD